MANEFNIQLDPTSQSGLLVYVRIKLAGGEVVGSPIELTEIEEESGFYTGDLNIELDPNTYIIVFYNNDGNGVLGIGELYWTGQKELTLLDLEMIRKALLNNMKVEDNQLIIYEDDAATPAYVFNLYDSAGEPTSTNITEIENA